MASQGQVQDKAKQAKEWNKASEKAKKDKKPKSYQAKRDQQEDNTLASGTNTTSIKKKTGQN